MQTQTLSVNQALVIEFRCRLDLFSSGLPSGDKHTNIILSLVLYISSDISGVRGGQGSEGHVSVN